MLQRTGSKFLSTIMEILSWSGRIYISIFYYYSNKRWKRTWRLKTTYTCAITTFLNRWKEYSRTKHLKWPLPKNQRRLDNVEESHRSITCKDSWQYREKFMATVWFKHFLCWEAIFFCYLTASLEVCFGVITGTRVLWNSKEVCSHVLNENSWTN